MQSNYLRCCKIVMQLGAKKILQVLERHTRREYLLSLADWLQANRSDLYPKLGGMNKWVRRLVYPDSGQPDLPKLDITALKVIVTKLMDDFPRPQQGWNDDPPPSDLTKGADIVRLGKLRNDRLIAHTATVQLTREEFDSHWSKAKEILLRLDPRCASEIQRIRDSNQLH